MVTGGAQVAIAVDDSARSVGIARALNNKYAMGGSRYRSGADSGPCDTVYLGAFRTAQLRSAGGWDEYFETNQDFELNRRLGRAGVVWFDSRLEVGYVPRQTITALWRQYHRFGRWKVRYWRRTGDRPQRRQLVPMIVTPVAALAAVATVVLLPPPSRDAIGVAAALGTGLLALDSPRRGGPCRCAGPGRRRSGHRRGSRCMDHRRRDPSPTPRFRRGAMHHRYGLSTSSPAGTRRRRPSSVGKVAAARRRLRHPGREPESSWSQRRHR